MTDMTPDAAYKLIETVAAETLTFAVNASSEIQTNVSRLLAILQRPVIDLFQLRAHVLSQGLPSQGLCAPSLRSLVWKLLLGVLPPVRSEWTAACDRNRATYEEYVYDLVHEPELIGYLRLGAPSPSSKKSTVDERFQHLDRVPTDDHPLAPPDSPSRWRRYWRDSEIFDQVNKDVFRTRPDMEFFSLPTDTLTNAVTVRGRAVSMSDLGNEHTTSPKSHAFQVANVISPKSHYDRICRILFMHAKLNFGYVQGMNELVAPLYYTFYNDPVEGHFVEADTFFGLTALMQEQRDIFCKTLDESSVGMAGRLGRLSDLLEREDPQVSSHLLNLGIRMDYFALRWTMLLFAQEFDISSVQVLWDAILSDQTPTSKISQGHLVNYLAVAMIQKVREAVLAGDFTDTMRVLQRYPPFEPRELIKAANALRRGNVKNDSIFSTASEDVLAVLAPEVIRRQRSSNSRKSPKASLTSRVMNFVRGRGGTHRALPAPTVTVNKHKTLNL